MNKNILIISLLFITSTFLACGGSDITPPGDINPGEPGTPTSPMTEMLGKKTGIVEIKLLGTPNSISEVAEVLVYKKEGVDNNLELSFNSPNLVLGGTSASDFKKIDDTYNFVLGSFKPIATSLEGDNIPAYIREWFPGFTLTKIELGTLKCESGGVYDLNTKMLSMKYSTSLVLHYLGEVDPLTGFKLELNYSNLINK